MRAYTSYFKLRFINGFQYRTAAIAGIGTQFFWGFIYIMIYQAFYLDSTSKMPISFQEMVNYTWLQQAFLVFFMLWIRDNELLELIKSGNISYELCRPHEIYPFWLAKIIAQRLSGAILRFFPIIIVAVLMPHPYKLTLPKSPMAFLLFVIALIFGLLITSTISLITHLVTFLTIEATGIMNIIFVISDLLSGNIVPIPFMPDFFKTICYLLPFRLCSDLPFRTYSGNIDIREASFSILLQIFWILILVFMGNSLIKIITKKIVVQGG